MLSVSNTLRRPYLGQWMLVTLRVVEELAARPVERVLLPRRFVEKMSTLESSTTSKADLGDLRSHPSGSLDFQSLTELAGKNVGERRRTWAR